MENIFVKPLEIIRLKFVQNLMKTIKLLFLVFLLNGCVWDIFHHDDEEVEYVNVDRIEVYKGFDPITKSYCLVYVAVCNIDGKEEKIRVNSDKVRVIKVHKKMPFQTP